MRERAPRLPLLDRLWASVDKTETCWTWTGGRTSAGYGAIYDAGKQYAVHRLAYTAIVGPIPDGLDLDHLCRVRHCVNPEHLEPVTRRTNVLRGIGSTAVNATKTQCPQGHPLSGDNLFIHRGHRQCRTCRRAHSRAAYRRRKALVR